ncbi:hypothetical protein N656DRAFT_793462 [Canariomyces notabilis]|uniref:Uncharacterized protein n=1 Tax=Canariomyces notabilis TaxID=2074819 RepID=A0AAN6T6W5_9PEZI|nr:hypothetical protein N656DRAFT_793462 [Canariomyces arenarius]
MNFHTRQPLHIDVWGCDLFLLEQWDADSTQPPDKQTAQIFSRFLQLPLSERLVRHPIHDPSLLCLDLSQAEQDILALTRPYNERKPNGDVWLRTYYGPGSDEAFTAILASVDAPDCPLSDAARYDYGDDWQRMMLRARYNYYHLTRKVGVIYVLNDLTLGPAQGSGDGDVRPEDRQLLVERYDADSRTVRWRRMGAEEACEHAGLINSASIDDHPVCTTAEIGDDYYRDSEEEDEGEDGDEDWDGGHEDCVHHPLIFPGLVHQ